MTSCKTPEDADTLAPALPDDLINSAVAALQAAEDCGCTLATAESCTGGLLASLLTDIEGVGHLFDRGFVTYSDASKWDLLGVPYEMIATEGAVSERVACAMAKARCIARMPLLPSRLQDLQAREIRLTRWALSI